MTAPELQDAMKRFQEVRGSREQHLGMMLIELSTSGQPCDVTFYNRSPILDVKVDQQLALAMMYGAGAMRLKEMLDQIKFSDGTTASFGEIWTINPMPKGGFSQDELDTVDLSMGDQESGPNGETLRQMIKETYHCKSEKDADHFLRRFLAS
jgi:hypothetical protein